ncbi:integrase catalytic domain-containing protein [Trichonephila clavipes]|nr:integrase catalytic domain-containing protein [Trichonephila clavipes]
MILMTKFPVILPSDHTVVKLLIMNEHVDLLHAGTSMLMSHLHGKYWIIKARKTIRNCIRKCVKRQRFTSKRCDENPGILPNDRVREAAIFEIVGLYLKSARVEKWIPGRDGQIRLAVIKTASWKFLRPVQRLFRLEMDSHVLRVAEDSTSVITKRGRLVKPPVRL